MNQRPTAAQLPPNRFERSNTWWNGRTETERFLLYYTCLRYHYEMPAQEALDTARKNWPCFGQGGDLMTTIREGIYGAHVQTEG